MLSAAVAHHQAGRLSEAEAGYRQVLRAKPRQPDALHLLGLIAFQRNRFQDAEDLLRRAIDANGSVAEFHADLGNTLLSAGRPDEAIAACEAALAINPQLANAHYLQGIAQKNRGRIAEAEACYRRSLQFDGDRAEVHNALGNVLMFEDRADEAAAAYRRAVEIRPDYGLPLHGLGTLAARGRIRLADAELTHLRTLLDGDTLAPNDASLIHFALADVLHAAGDYDPAFSHYRKANDSKAEVLRSKGQAFDGPHQRRFVDRVIATYTPESLRKWQAFGADSERPVFVVGMPRSGTTLVERILASHPDIAGVGELVDVGRRVVELQRAIGGVYPNCMARISRPIVDGLVDRHDRLLTDLVGGADEEGTVDEKGTGPICAKHPSGRSGKLDQSPFRPLRVVDKRPTNFNYLGFLSVLYPHARVVHCRRDPRDVCLSCYCQNLKAAFSVSLEGLAFYYRQYERIMEHWRTVGPLPIYDVRYEELVAEPERIAGELIAFCGLAWDPACLDFHQNREAVQSASSLQVRRPVYTSSVARWKRYEKHLGPLLRALKESK